MARIEIPMDEYKGMKEKIETLEKALVESKKKTELFQHKYETLALDLEDLGELSLYERVFYFGKNIKRILEENELGD